MIDSLTYEQVLEISKELKRNADIINHLIKNKTNTELQDFTSTVEGYSKYLETIVELNQDADKALEELNHQKK